MKILILSSVLALSLGFPGWLFRSYGQNRELFQHAGQKIASLEEEKSSLEEQLNKHHPNTQNPDADSILGKQEEYLKRQILKQDQNMDALQRFLQESEHQLRLLKTKERELKNLLEKKKKEEASIIHAPQSIAGATITIEYKLEGEDNVSKKTLKSG